jgi:hypothetical protein
LRRDREAERRRDGEKRYRDGEVEDREVERQKDKKTDRKKWEIYNHGDMERQRNGNTEKGDRKTERCRERRYELKAT